MKKLLLPLILLVMAFSLSCDDSSDDDSNPDQVYMVQFRMGFEPNTDYGFNDEVLDTMIQEGSAADNGASTSMHVGAWVNSNRRALIKFIPAAYVPSFATITRAVLSLYSSNVFGNFTIDVHNVVATWAESATWTNSGFQGWAGGIYDTAVISSKKVTTKTSSLTEVSFDLDTGVVQEWIDDPWSNQGLILIPADGTVDESDALFCTSEHAEEYLRPALTIEYRL
ncbi:MAG TPA: DNRLRE domain-containing protein [Spirochaetota bacterium]|nr:DNRLRE domain-containing protein [Spirochaetota bacterium]